MPLRDSGIHIVRQSTPLNALHCMQMRQTRTDFWLVTPKVIGPQRGSHNPKWRPVFVIDAILTTSYFNRNTYSRNAFLHARVRPAPKAIWPIHHQPPQSVRGRTGQVLTERMCTIAPRNFYAWRARRLSNQTVWHATITAVLTSYQVERDGHGWRRPESLYRSVIVSAKSDGRASRLPRCALQRLIRVNRWHVDARSTKVRTTTPDASAPRAVNQACSLRLMQGNSLRGNIIKPSRTMPHDAPSNRTNYPACHKAPRRSRGP